ncbi:tRNA lysidine(34) synthetase TilS, partial [bacterium]|nr:tRNA lysidine(34) synthetase TilS [bacterium]
MSDPGKTVIQRAKIILEENLPDSDSPLLVALSGGSDSISLAKILIDLKSYHGRKIYAYHLDHQLRPESSRHDADFVEKWCHKNSLELKIERAVDLEGIRREKNYSLEEAAREYRYARLVTEARRIDASAILTGHTLDDNVETFLLRIATGASLKALCGIPICSTYDGIPVIRPLINCLKEELREYLKSQSETWVEDETNLVPDTLRNKVRLQVLPQFSKILSKDVTEPIARTIFNLKRDSDLLDMLLEENISAEAIWKPFKTHWKFGYIMENHELADMHSAERYRMILWALNRLNLPLKRRNSGIFFLADDFINLNGGKRSHHIGNGIYIARSGPVFICAKTKEETPNAEFNPISTKAVKYIMENKKMNESKIEANIQKPGKYSLGDYEITVEKIDRTEINSSESENRNCSIE